MKANELMVGDILLNENADYVLVRSVSDTAKKDFCIVEVLDGVHQGEIQRVHCEDLTPTILTPEILKKNGFENRGAQFFCDRIGMIWWKDNIFMFSKYTRHEDLPTENISINIGYVHELQHALRLCGIDKTITL